MIWLETSSLSPQPLAGERLAQLWAQDGILRIPGAHNAMAGLLAKEAGFKTLYISGAAVTASMGLPDLGILTMEELCFTVRSIVRATDMPVIVDGDTGYGEALNVMRLVRELEGTGAAAVQIEDQVLPKKCGHLNDKTLVSIEQMAAKIAAARRARSHLRIIARTDIAATEGVEGTIKRAKAYVDAGADAIFPEALTTHDNFREFAEAMTGSYDVPLLANMTEFGRTPQTSAQEFEALGYKMVIWPVTSLRIAAEAMRQMYGELATQGSAEEMLDRMQSRQQLWDEIIGYFDYEALDDGLIKSVLPDVEGKL